MLRVARTIARTRLLIVAVFAGCEFAGCDPCDRDACDFAETPRSPAQISQGVVGVIANVPTDDCKDGCCACAWSDTELRLVEATERVTRHNAASFAAQSKSSKTIHAHHAYEQALDPGDYLLCVDGGDKGASGDICAGLHIAAGNVFTVNVHQAWGRQSLTVFGPDDKDSRDDLVFTVPRQQ